MIAPYPDLPQDFPQGGKGERGSPSNAEKSNTAAGRPRILIATCWFYCCACLSEPLKIKDLT